MASSIPGTIQKFFSDAYDVSQENIQRTFWDGHGKRNFCYYLRDEKKVIVVLDGYRGLHITFSTKRSDVESLAAAVQNLFAKVREEKSYAFVWLDFYLGQEGRIDEAFIRQVTPSPFLARNYPLPGHASPPAERELFTGSGFVTYAKSFHLYAGIGEENVLLPYFFSRITDPDEDSLEGIFKRLYNPSLIERARWFAGRSIIRAPLERMFQVIRTMESSPPTAPRGSIEDRIYLLNLKILEIQGIRGLENILLNLLDTRDTLLQMRGR